MGVLFTWIIECVDIKHRLVIGILSDALQAQNGPKVENVLEEIESEFSSQEMSEEDKKLCEKANEFLDQLKNNIRICVCISIFYS